MAVLGALSLIMVIAGCVPFVEPTPSAGRATVAMNPMGSEGFFSLPWPNDIRKKADGTLDLAGLPDNSNVVLRVVIDRVGASVSDFATNGAIYLRTTAPIDPSTLPNPTSSVVPASPILVVNVDDPTDRIPVVARVDREDVFRPSNLISLLPYPGHAMRSNARYVVAVTDALHAADGQPLEPSWLIGALDGDEWQGKARSEGDWRALRRQRDEARAALTALGVDPARLVGFTALHTQDSQRDLRAMAATLDMVTIDPPTLTTLAACAAGTTSVGLSGTIRSPQFQAGAAPFELDGGAIIVGADGRAVLRGWSTIPLELSVPCGPSPVGGWPVVTWVNGTGGGASVQSPGVPPVYDRAVVASIPPTFGEGTEHPDPNELLFYNPLNPAAARSNILQQTIDDLVLLRSLDVMRLDPTITNTMETVGVNPDRTLIVGQSQGAQTLPLVASLRPVSGILSGSGSAGFYNQFAYRSSSRGILGAFAPIDTLDITSPVVQLVEQLIDAGDPANYPTTTNFLNLAGRDDSCVPLESSRHQAASQNLTVVYPQFGSIFASPSLDPPTAAFPYTAPVGAPIRVSIELPGGHFAIAYNPDLEVRFTESVFDGTPLGLVDEIRNSLDNCPGVHYGPIASGL